MHANLDYLLPNILLRIPFQEINSLPFTLNIYEKTEILYSDWERNYMVDAFKNEILKSKSSYREVTKVNVIDGNSISLRIKCHLLRLF